MADEEKNSYDDKGAIHDYVVHGSDQSYELDVSDRDHVQRKLKERHVQMIAVSVFDNVPLSCTQISTDCWYHRYWSFPGIRTRIVRRRSSRCPRCLRIGRNCRLLVPLRVG